MLGPIKGHNGQISFDGAWVTITRKGFLGRASIGKGEKRIPIGSITAVQWKPPGAVMNGFIAFSLAGGVEKQSRFGSQTSDASRDENTVLVTKSQEQSFLDLRAVIENAIAARHAPVAPASAPQPPVTAGPPPGWYADPDGSAQKRWWNGSRWTEHRQA
ncbi:MAG TPA: DUF4429 domain-containing protein [Kineosporiaceae bacterium]|nr:DUF4429 domain-containing protein [Kineosporiaceae bacterium]